mmetsp:Transcript_17468/g.26276  ORF Transcript_17468/g.26276 Transcript_17468/m.26276 type:complete len:433 (+) Transcript_17468:72-1370(+)
MLFSIVAVIALSIRSAANEVTPHHLARRLSLVAQEKDENCLALVEAYDRCTASNEEDLNYWYDTTGDYYDDTSAECRYLASGGSCGELVDDGDSSCLPLFYKAVECYYSSTCGTEIHCGDENPFASTRRLITFYNSYPEDEAVCFFWGSSDAETMMHTEKPLMFGDVLTMEIEANDQTIVGFAASLTIEDCDSIDPTTLHNLDLFVSNINTYGVGVKADGTIGPKAWRSDVSGDPLSTIFVNEAKGYENCVFSLLQGLTDIGGPVELDDGLAQDLDCGDYREAVAVIVECDNERATYEIEPSSICARATQEFMAVGNKNDPENFPLSLLLVQGNEECDYVCGPTDPTPIFSLGFEYFFAFDFFLSSTSSENQTAGGTDAQQPTYRTLFLISLFLILLASITVFISHRFFTRRIDQGEVSKLKTPLLADAYDA